MCYKISSRVTMAWVGMGNSSLSSARAVRGVLQRLAGQEQSSGGGSEAHDRESSDWAWTRAIPLVALRARRLLLFTVTCDTTAVMAV